MSSTEKWAEELRDKVLDAVDGYVRLDVLDEEQEDDMNADVLAAIISSHSPVKEVYEGLELYGRHLLNCAVGEDAFKKCTCGFSDILAKHKHQ